MLRRGTIFQGPQLEMFKSVQEGQTDSERILYYIIDEVNKKQDELGWPLTPEERFRLLDELVTRLSAGNKLNLLVWDGEYMYVHTNYRGTLHMLQKDADTLWFSHGHLTTLLGKPCPSCGCLSFGRGDWCSKVKGAARNISTLKRTLSTNGWILPTFDDRDIFLKKHLQESKKCDIFALSK